MKDLQADNLPFSVQNIKDSWGSSTLGETSEVHLCENNHLIVRWEGQ